MQIEDIKQKITELAIQHFAIDDFKDCVHIEEEAEDLIVAFCEQRGYTVNGFPTQKRELYDIDKDEEEYEEYFCRERFQLYLDTLALQHDDVAELCWHYNSSFWPDFFGSKEEFLANALHDVTHGCYGVEL